MNVFDTIIMPDGSIKKLDEPTVRFINKQQAEIDQLRSVCTGGNRMTPTMKLRFVKRSNFHPEFNPNNFGQKRVLQQWWDGEVQEEWGIDGDIENIIQCPGEWRDVKTEDES